MAGSTIPERIEFAIEVLDPRPGETVIEAGGGPGVAAALVCEAIAPNGTMTMLDRSTIAVERAGARNAEIVARSVLSIERRELASFVGGPFDAFFCVDLNVFWTGGAAEEITAITRSLRPGGRAAIVYGVGPNGPHNDQRLRPIVTNLGSAGFGEVKVVHDRRGVAITAIRE